MSEKGINFVGIEKICLIGGGRLMYRTVKVYQLLGYRVSAVIAPRHKDYLISDTNMTFKNSLIDAKIDLEITEDINDLSSWDQKRAAA